MDRIKELVQELGRVWLRLALAVEQEVSKNEDGDSE